MNKSTNKRSKRLRKTPYCKIKPGEKDKPSEMNVENGVLQLNTDSESELLKDDSDSNQNAVQYSSTSSNGKQIVDVAKDEMMLLLKEIRDSQCTKDDLLKYGLTIKKQFNEVDKRITSNATTINSMESRINSIESTLALNQHDTELTKQNVLSRNLSIMGVPAAENEDLTSIALKIFALVGCHLTNGSIFGCYRIKKGNSFTNIFIVKMNDLGVKHQILKSKVNMELRLNDVITFNPRNDNPLIYVNNHLTPFFGKLLAEGRKAVKERKIHSVWLAKNGCHLRLEVNGKEQIYRNTNELERIIVSYQRKSNKRSRPDDDRIPPENLRQPKK